MAVIGSRLAMGEEAEICTKRGRRVACGDGGCSIINSDVREAVIFGKIGNGDAFISIGRTKVSLLYSTHRAFYLSVDAPGECDAFCSRRESDSATFGQGWLLMIPSLAYQQVLAASLLITLHTAHSISVASNIGPQIPFTSTFFPPCSPCYGPPWSPPCSVSSGPTRFEPSPAPPSSWPSERVRTLPSIKSRSHPDMSTPSDSTLPHVPKASPSPYALYVKDYFARESENLKSGGGKIHISEISSKIADEWKSLPDGEKAKYETTAKQLRTSYESELKTFLSTLSSTDKAALKTSTGKSMKLPVKLRGGEGERKRPLSAFFEFLADMRKTGGLDASVSGSNKVTSFAKAGGDRWKSMSEGEKKVGAGAPLIRVDES